MVFLAISELYNSSYTVSGGWLYHHHLSELNSRSRHSAESGTRRDSSRKASKNAVSAASLLYRSLGATYPPVAAAWGVGMMRGVNAHQGENITMLFQGFVATLNDDGGRKKVPAAICP